MSFTPETFEDVILTRPRRPTPTQHIRMELQNQLIQQLFLQPEV